MPGPSKIGRDTRFKPGNPGGPGRRQGSRPAALLALDALAEGVATDVVIKVVEAAKGGDLKAADMLLSRIWPIRKGRQIKLAVPSIRTAADVVAALGAVTDAVAAGDLTPDEGSAVANVIEIKRRTLETEALEKRIAALEERNKP